MKLLKLELYDDFRSLKKGFVANFLEELDNSKLDDFYAYCIVGRNGSGKSNILEVLSNIFYQIELDNLDTLPKKREENEDGIVEYTEIESFLTYTKKPNAFKLEYLIKPDKQILKNKYNGFIDGYIHVTISKKENEQALIYLNRDEENRPDSVEIKAFFPFAIVGYSSGENETLSLPYLRTRMIQYDEYAQFLYEDNHYLEPESRLVYLDENFSQAIFISNFLFPDVNVHSVFEDTVGVKDIKSFRIIINKNIKTQTLYDEKYELYSGIKGNMHKLFACATLYWEDKVNEQLILDFYVDDVCREAFKKHFGDKLELFKFFQVLINLNYYHIDEKTRDKLYDSNSPYAKGFMPEASWDDRFFTFKNFWIEKEDPDNLILTRNLSDGEHQFMHSIGVALLYKNTSSLFLLDEPETHFNPSWRAKYISTIRECFKGDESFPEVLITSHSPFIVSDSKTENVLVFEKNEHNVVECTRPNFNTFGASVNKITMGIFEKRETIGEYANEIISKFKQRMETTDDLEALFFELDETIGDSIEKTLFMKELFDRIEKK